MDVTGLLKANEMYCNFWNGRTNSKKIFCSRSPLVHNEKVTQNLYIFIIEVAMISHYLFWLIKGLCAPFDFHKFAKEVAHAQQIKDVWGKEYNIKFVLTNYQYLQTLDLSHEDIKELAVPTINKLSIVWAYKSVERPFILLYSG